MIFVTVGTTHFQFDRLLSAVAALDTGDELVVQRGPSRVPLGSARVMDFLSFDELNDHVRQADTVITHAGVGSIMVALSRGSGPWSSRDFNASARRWTTTRCRSRRSSIEAGASERFSIWRISDGP